MTLKKMSFSLLLLNIVTETIFTTTSCSCTSQNQSTDQKIVNFVNSYNNYEAPIIVNSTYGDAINEITPGLIKAELSIDLKNKFDDSLFNPKIITDLNDVQLTDDAFKTYGIIVQAKLIYDYGKFDNQITQLKLPVINSDEQKIIDGINSSNYDIDIEINTEYNALKNMIDAAFIKAKLSAELQSKFIDANFKLFSITNENWDELKDANLTEYKVIDVKINYGYYTVNNESTNLRLRISSNNEDNVVVAINNANYTTDVRVKSKYVDLEGHINAGYIKTQLSSDLQVDFVDSAFNLLAITDSSGTKLTDEDFVNTKIISAKINYDYGSTKNQNTNLTVNVEKLQLDVELRDFELRDRKNIVGFLDGNNLSNISKEIETYLSLANFEEAGLTFENQTSNSVVVKATADSEFYQGQITISWNLKLFEVWGISIRNQSDPDLSNGLKGYFYLEKDTNLIKYFNVFGFLTGKKVVIHSYFNNYHRLTFKNANNQIKDFTINGKWYTDEISGYFESFDFTTGVAVTVNSPEPVKLKIFNLQNNQWVATTNRVYNFNNLGISN